MNRPVLRIFPPLLALALGGCASVDPKPDYRRLAREVNAATGAHDVFDPACPEVLERVNSILASPVTADGAVQVALLNSPRIQADIIRLGVGRADVVQAGLLSNPSISVSYRFSTGSGGDVIQANIAQDIAELWQIGPRKRAAEREQDALILEVANNVAELAAQVRAAFWRVVAADSVRGISADAEKLAQSLLDAASERKTAGAGTEVDVKLARSAFSEATVEARRATLQASSARRALLRALGITGDGRSITLDATESTTVAELPTTDTLLAVAASRRLDLRAAAKATAAAEANVLKQRRGALKVLRAGADFERADQTTVGPLVELDIPIFDQNRAQIAKAEFEHQRAQHLEDAIRREADQDIRDAADRYIAASDIRHLYDSEILVQRRDSIALAEESYRAGKTGLLTVLEARRVFVDGRAKAAEANTDAGIALAELERAIGTRLSEINSNSSPSAPTEKAP